MSDFAAIRSALEDQFQRRAGMKPPPSVARAYASLGRIERASEDLLARFHEESECGVQGPHWPECAAMSDALGPLEVEL